MSSDSTAAIRLQSLFRGHLTRRSNTEAARVREVRDARNNVGGTITNDGETSSDEVSTTGAVPPSPFLPTPHTVVSEILRLSGVTSSSTLLDIGCGDARVCFSASRDYNAYSIGLEALDTVYMKAREARNVLPQEIQSRVELHHASFMTDIDLLEHALDRSDIIFVFLLPSDMGVITKRIVESVERKVRRAKEMRKQQQQVQEQQSTSSSTALPSSPSPPLHASTPSCPCPAEVHTRVLSWTFSLQPAASATASTTAATASSSPPSSSSTNLVLPLTPTLSIALESQHTKLHVYDICGCKLYQNDMAVDGTITEPHAHVITRGFFPTPSSSTSSSPTPSFNPSHIVWGHALNSISSLLSRLNETRVDGGLFIECDLRVMTDADGKRRVIMAHDAGSEGPIFSEWYSSLLTYHKQYPHHTPLGLKLDFKQIEAVESTLKELRDIVRRGERVWGRCSGDTSSDDDATASAFLWLNADILIGPAAPSTSIPIPSREFLDLCSEFIASSSSSSSSAASAASASSAASTGASISTASCFASTVVSIGWMTGSHESEYYTHAHVSEMLDLLTHSYPRLHQLTFPLRASMIRRSWEAGTIQRLLAHSPNTTFTVWTSRVDQARRDAQEEEQWIRDNLPKARTFVDLVL